MKATTLLGVMLAAVAVAAPAHAVFKCTTANGVLYQDLPCKEGDETKVRIVIPTGELAPKTLSGSGSQDNLSRRENGTAARKTSGTANEESATLNRGPGKSANAVAGSRGYESAVGAGSEGRSRDGKNAAVGSADNASAAEQARNSEPSAKYYATERFGNGSETPSHMTCETANGEKRVFYLSNGKLSSI